MFDPNPDRPPKRASPGLLRIRILGNACLGFEPLQTLFADRWREVGPNLHDGFQFAPNVTTGVTTVGRLARIPRGFARLFWPTRGSLSFFYGRNAKKLTPDDERSTPGVFRFYPTFWAFSASTTPAPSISVRKKRSRAAIETRAVPSGTPDLY